MDLKPTTCRYCGTDMIFGVTEKGRRMPLDAAPEPDGPWTITAWGDLRRATAETPPEKRHRTHFETCPHADQARKRSRQ